jgi:ABC-2 type transport system permease protein
VIVGATLAAMRAELTKLRSIRGTLIALMLFVPCSIVVAALDGASAKAAIESHSQLLRAGFTAEQAGLDGILYGQLALLVFGVLAVASEYATGMIRISLLAVPSRGCFYTAKMVTVALAVAIVAIPVTVLSYLVTQFALGSHGASILAAGVPRALAGAVAYLTLMSLFAAGIAALTRSVVAPLVILLPTVLAGSQILSVIGATRAVARYFPDQAGMQLLTVGSHRAGTGLAVLLAWTVAAQLGGYLRHRGDV